MLKQQRQNTQFNSTPKEIFESMIEAANRHDLEAMVAYFAPYYRGELPFSPERNVIDRAGVRHNWSNFFSTMPDFRVELLSAASEGNVVWAELFFHGTRADGIEQMMQGVNIAEIQAERIVSGKLYQNTVKNFPKTALKEGQRK